MSNSIKFTKTRGFVKIRLRILQEQIQEDLDEIALLSSKSP